MLLTFAGLPCMAQSESGADSTTRLMQFAANNAEFDATVEARATELFKTQITACAVPEKAVRQLPSIYGEVYFPADPKGEFPYPERGVWAEHVKVKGCGRIWTVNMLAVARDTEEGQKPPMLLALMPGDTLGDPAVQRSAERIGATAVKKADAETCADDPYATYTKILGFLQDDGTLGKTDAGKGWFEEWTYRFCQRDIPVQMAYTANGKGGYDIKARIVPTSMPNVPTQKPTTAADVKDKADEAPEAPTGRRVAPTAPLLPKPAGTTSIDPLN